MGNLLSYIYSGNTIKDDSEMLNYNLKSKIKLSQILTAADTRNFIVNYYIDLRKNVMINISYNQYYSYKHNQGTKNLYVYDPLRSELTLYSLFKSEKKEFKLYESSLNGSFDVSSNIKSVYINNTDGYQFKFDLEKKKICNFYKVPENLYDFCLSKNEKFLLITCHEEDEWGRPYV